MLVEAHLPASLGDRCGEDVIGGPLASWAAMVKSKAVPMY
jgi:hypothetical protein